ncbi:zinc ribbon domain-containing protein [Marivirga tractuosa]|uniref:zinc ribbon domain-containing protein n=1 Tax=Marivirga tractuosa TaxID=1006 RepID=UPI0035D09F7E
MMEQSQIQCSKCKTTLSQEDIFCPNCGYPENGGQEEKDKFDYRIKLKMNVLKDAKKKLKNVKILLWVLAAFHLLAGLFYLTQELTFYDGIGTLIASIIFIACVFWVKNQPLTGIMAAFVFWILLQLSVVFVDPSLLFHGIILKIIFIGIFVKGISSAKDYKEFSQKLQVLNAPNE